MLTFLKYLSEKGKILLEIFWNNFKLDNMIMKFSPCSLLFEIKYCMRIYLDHLSACPILADCWLSGPSPSSARQYFGTPNIQITTPNLPVSTFLVYPEKRK